MYRTAATIEDGIELLAAVFPQYVTRLPLPEPSIEGRTIHALRLRAGEGEDRRGLLVVGGTHARELMNPDAILDLAVDLVTSYDGGTDLVYGGRTWPAATVRAVMDALDVWLLPCSNPDGRHHVMTVDDMWRKNRRNNPGPSIGVDLNRNLDLLWGVVDGNHTSCSASSDTYCGPSAFSEPETRNVRYLLDTRRIHCFVDVHSFSELVLHPWGHAPTQTTDPSQVFTSLPTGTCSWISDPDWAEYMPPRDWTRFTKVAGVIADAMDAVRGRSYTPQSSYALYGTTGSHQDYAWSRHVADPDRQKTYAFTFETGPFVGNNPDSFHPPNPDPIKLEAKSGILALAQQCICAIELIGNRFLGGGEQVAALRRVRDDHLATTEAGQAWIAMYDHLQPALVAAALRDPGMAREAASLVEAAAAVASDRAVLDEDMAASARELLVRVAEHVDGDRLPDLELLRAHLDEVVGRSGRDIIDAMVRRPPRGDGEPDGGKP